MYELKLNMISDVSKIAIRRGFVLDDFFVAMSPIIYNWTPVLKKTCIHPCIVLETKYYSAWGFVDKTHFLHCSGFLYGTTEFAKFYRISQNMWIALQGFRSIINSIAQQEAVF